MLKEFRSIDVYWDKATKRIHEKIRSSSSDEKGRKLTVQIVNDGQIQDLTNVALNLYWETQDGENRGLDPFELLDPENGIYELYFHTGMLKHVGKLNAHLHLVDTTGAITSEPFTIFVFSGINVDAMASDDELSALNQALIEVQNIKQDEAERVSAETERITAEEERVSNENERKTAETTRNTNETTRVSNETDRVNAEDTRKTNETNRVDAESNRVTAETARVTAEEEREQGYPLLDGRLTTVEQNIDEHLADYANLVANKVMSESGSNENGKYVRFADGLQICWTNSYLNSPSRNFVWTFPAAFHSAWTSRRTSNKHIFGTLKISMGFDGENESALFYPAITRQVFSTENYTKATIEIAVSSMEAGRQSDLMMLAIGRWKG